MFFRPSKLYYVKKRRKSHAKTYCHCWNELKTFYKPPIAQYMQNTLLIKLKLNSLKSRISLFSTNLPDKQLPAEILEIAAKIEEADGVIIGTPEYDHSIPAVLMSALAWLSYGIYHF